MSSGARLTVVLPVFNGAPTLAVTLESIAHQTRPVDELVVVDDGSVDATPAILERFETRLPLHVLRNPHNEGIADSLRRGVAAATGELVLRLDADDRWLPMHASQIERLANVMPLAQLFATRVIVKKADGQRIGLSPLLTDETVRRKLMWDNPLVHSATAFRREAYEQTGGYRQATLWEDYDLWIRLLEKGPLAFGLIPTVVFTSSQNSLSRVAKKRALAGRWKLQKTAIRRFSKMHPAAAAVCGSLGALRQAVALLS